MSRTYIPAGYKNALSLYDTQAAIGQLKRIFEDQLSVALNLKRVSAPLFVDPGTGLNDDLNGVERPVSFDIADTSGHGQVVHSLAKWKRMALKTLRLPGGRGPVHRHERHSPRRGHGQPALDLRRPMGLGEGHSPRGSHPDLPQGHGCRPSSSAICLTSDAMRARYPQLSFKPCRDGQLRHHAGAGGHAIPT